MLTKELGAIVGSKEGGPDDVEVIINCIDSLKGFSLKMIFELDFYF